MSYWDARTRATITALTDKSIDEIEKQLKKYYRSVSQKVLGQFETTFNAVLLDIEEGKEPTPADLYKLDKYWQMQGQVQEELRKLGVKEISLLEKEMLKHYETIYNALALEGKETFYTIERANQVIKQIWCADGKSWSERVWTNTARLQETLNEELVHCVVAGNKPTELKHKLMSRFDVSYSAADNIVRTEIAHIETEAARDRYLDYGIEEVEVLVSPDERTCDICGKLEGKRFPVNGKMPVPAHPRCRCAIVPVIPGS